MLSNSEHISQIDNTFDFRFYYAYSISKNIEMLKKNTKLVAVYLTVGLQQFLTKISLIRINRNIPRAEDFFSILNTIYLDAFLTLAKIKINQNVQIELISAEDLLKL